MESINSDSNQNVILPKINTYNNLSAKEKKFPIRKSNGVDAKSLSKNIKPTYNCPMKKQSDRSISSNLNNKIYSNIMRQKIERGDYLKQETTTDVFESASSLPGNDAQDSNFLDTMSEIKLPLCCESFVGDENEDLPSVTTLFRLYLDSLNDQSFSSNNIIENIIQKAESNSSLFKHSLRKFKKKDKKDCQLLIADCSASRYDIVKASLKVLGFKIVEESNSESFLIWSDVPVSTECISELKPHQRINHFPGMLEICRKDYLIRNMARMARAFPNLYNFTPKTFILPNENLLCQNYLKDMKQKKKEKYLIIKPVNGAMGIGISLCRNIEKINPSAAYIVQEYIERPLLIDSYKCDLRIYVLLTSCDPLHLFVFNDGLLRMGTEKYSPPMDSNLECMFMHLTNYSVNKKNENYIRGKTDMLGSKRSLSYLKSAIEMQNVPFQRVWADMCDLIIKTVIMVHPYVYHSYRMCRIGQPASAHSVCFEILGFDILLDRKFKPWLLEVNRSPSFATDEAVDHNIKSLVIMSAVKLLNLKLKNKQQTVAQEKFLTQQRLLKASKKITNDLPEEVKNKIIILERRKEELYNLLQRIKKDEERDIFERRNSGQYQRIFPTDDQNMMDKYVNILKEAHRIYISAQHSSLHQEIIDFYTNKLKDYEVEELIEECVAELRQIENLFEISRKTKDKFSNISQGGMKLLTTKGR